MPVCCSRPAAAPPNMNTTAASTQATTGQRARAPIAATDNPPIRRCACTRRSNVAQRRRRIEQRVQHHQRREDQRLRIGDARMPAIVIGIPERRRAGFERRRQEAVERVELVLGIPRHDAVGEDPAAHRHEPDRADHETGDDQRARKRAALSTIRSPAARHTRARGVPPSRPWRRSPYNFSINGHQHDVDGGGCRVRRLRRLLQRKMPAAGGARCDDRTLRCAACRSRTIRSEWCGWCLRPASFRCRMAPQAANCIASPVLFL